jgi:hypothetical protein
MTYLKERGEFTGSLNTGLRKGEAATFNPENAGSSNNTNFVGTNQEALNIVQTYLGRNVTAQDFSSLIAATFAEASANQEERAWVAGVILNRTRSDGGTILDTLRKKNQFQAVTGTSANNHAASKRFISGPDPTEAASIYVAIKNFLTKVPRDFKYFTSNVAAAYGAGTNIEFRDKLAKAPGSRVIGQTIFSITA